MKKRTAIVLGVVMAAAGLVAGCQSSLVPLKPVQRIETWEPIEGTVAVNTTSQAATGPGTQAGAQVAGGAATEPGTQPATRPMRKVVKIVDPNQSVRFVYRANYDLVWRESMQLLSRTGFTLDRKDYRLGVLTTQALPSAQIVEFWKPQHTDAGSVLENTVNSQRRLVRITIARVPGKPEFFEIAIQVLVERETNPSEKLGGPIFAEGSGFGRSAVTLGSDYASPEPEKELWVKIGHDPKLERKLLDQLFEKI